jgi:hypothetical protein
MKEMDSSVKSWIKSNSQKNVVEHRLIAGVQQTLG